MSKPTGYEVTIPAEVLWVLLRTFGNTCSTDRREKYKHDREMDIRVSKAWSSYDHQLRLDGFPKYTWTGEDER